MEHINESLFPHILIGTIFYIFGLKWCSEYAKFWLIPRRDHDRDTTTKSKSLKRICQQLLTDHPVEGCLKLLATAVGLTGTVMGDLSDTEVVSPKVIHATIYLFFAFSGLIDVLTFYFPRNIPIGLAHLALAQSFFVEGFLFVWANPQSNIANEIFAGIVWITSIAIGLELIWPDLKLLRGFTTLLHGGWIAHMVRVNQINVLTPERIALAFSWHIAGAFGITLTVVAITRCCIPRNDPPPEVPVYDYCLEPGQLV